MPPPAPVINTRCMAFLRKNRPADLTADLPLGEIAACYYRAAIPKRTNAERTGSGEADGHDYRCQGRNGKAQPAARPPARHAGGRAPRQRRVRDADAVPRRQYL